MISFEKCRPEVFDDCHDDATILRWLEDKYILLLYQETRFNSNEFYPRSQIREKRLHYVPIST